MPDCGTVSVQSTDGTNGGNGNGGNGGTKPPEDGGGLGSALGLAALGAIILSDRDED